MQANDSAVLPTPAARLPSIASHSLCLYVIALCLIYIIVVVHTPMALLPAAPHDDALYVSLGRELAEGRWLGHGFNQFTLMKGPGYPVFLAISNWLGTPVSLAHALFHCFAIAAFVAVCHRFINSTIISALLFTCLLWHPISLSAYLFRILRDEIYYAQVLLVLAVFAHALFGGAPRERRLLFGVVGGASLGWFWLTREEGVWILPGLAVLLAGAALRDFRRHRIGELAAILLVAIATFGATQIAFRTANWVYYGKFIGVDFKETEFQRALQAIQSVRSGGVRPFVSITRAAREQVYAQSPAFASLADYLERAGPGWMVHSCGAVPISCGEIGSGWFMWALRDAAAAAGHYTSPTKASAFFKRVADEISAACARGSLQCAPQIVAEMPPWDWGDVLPRLVPSYREAFDLLLLLRPPVEPGPSNGTPEQLASMLRFLNYPAHNPIPESALEQTAFTLSGWYHESGAAWFSVALAGPDGQPAEVRLQRTGSPDIQLGFKDPEASQQRFVMRARCGGACVLQIQDGGGNKLEKQLTELRSGMGFDIGPGRLHFDSVELHANPMYVATRIDKIAARLRMAILTYYPSLFLVVLGIGIAAFLLASVRYWKTAATNVCYILALTAWVLTFMRVTLLVLITVTSMPSLLGFYLAPAYYMAICGAILSCAAWLQLSGRLSSSGRRTAPDLANPRNT